MSLISSDWEKSVLLFDVTYVFLPMFVSETHPKAQIMLRQQLSGLKRGDAKRFTLSVGRGAQQVLDL